MHLRSIEIYPPHRDFKPIQPTSEIRHRDKLETLHLAPSYLSHTFAAPWNPGGESDDGAEWKPFISEETDRSRIFSGSSAHVTRLAGFRLSSGRHHLLLWYKSGSCGCGELASEGASPGRAFESSDGHPFFLSDQARPRPRRLDGERVFSGEWPVEPHRFR